MTLLMAAFWHDQVEAMRTVYLPSSKSIVFEQDSRLLGFYAMYETTLAALFVAPAYQGTGIGSQLLTHAKHCHTQITLSVYTENKKSLAFLSQTRVPNHKRTAGHPHRTC